MNRINIAADTMATTVNQMAQDLSALQAEAPIPEILHAVSRCVSAAYDFKLLLNDLKNQTKDQ